MVAEMTAELSARKNVNGVPSRQLRGQNVGPTRRDQYR